MSAKGQLEKLSRGFARSEAGNMDTARTRQASNITPKIVTITGADEGAGTYDVVDEDGTEGTYPRSSRWYRVGEKGILYGGRVN